MTARGPLGNTASSSRRLPSQTAEAGRFAVVRPALPSSNTSLPDPDPAHADAARHRPEIAFAFQGGGSLAACQVGMARALGEAGVVADLVVGSSAGALNAVAFASGPESDLDVLERLWTSLRRRHVAPVSARLVLRALMGRADGLVSNAGLRAVIDDHLPRRLQDTRVPAHVVVTDLLTGAPSVISRGDTGPALLASSAFPGLYPPVRIAGRQFIDGGVSADVPVLQAEHLGAGVTYVLPAAVADDDTPAHGAMALAYRALGQVLDATARRAISSTQGVVHVLPAPTSGASNPVDFRDTARLIEDGYRLTRRWLMADRPARASSVLGETASTLVSFTT